MATKTLVTWQKGGVVHVTKEREGQKWGRVVTDDRTLTVTEIALLMGLSRPTVYGWGLSRPLTLRKVKKYAEEHGLFVGAR